MKEQMATQIDKSRLKNLQRIEEARMSGIISDMIYEELSTKINKKVDEKLLAILDKDNTEEFPCLSFSFGGGAHCQRCGIETLFFIYFFAFEQGNCTHLCTDCSQPYKKFLKDRQ